MSLYYHSISRYYCKKMGYRLDDEYEIETKSKQQQEVNIMKYIIWP